MLKKVIVLIIAACLAVTACGCSGGISVNDSNKKPQIAAEKYSDIKGTEYVECAQSGALKLSFCPSTTHFRIENTEDGSLWYSSPQDLSDETASKLVQMKMQASLIIDYTDTLAKKTGNINTYTGSVKSGDYSIELIDNGVRFVYHLSEINAYIPFEVYLENGALLTKIDTDNIAVSDKSLKITDISVTPYFLRGRADDNGYLFLADGSGALIRFKENVKSTAAYSRRIYGSEPTETTSDDYLRTDEESVHMPVWGAAVNGSAIVAIGESGEAFGTLNAYSCGQTSSYANVYTSYGLLNSVIYNLGNYETEIYDKIEKTAGTILTRYIFLSGDAADYNGMANAYRDYLIKRYSLNENNYNKGAYLDIYGSAVKTVSVMGVPHKKAVPLTSCGQLKEMLETLRGDGIEGVTVRFRNWNNNELFGKRVTSVSPCGSVISKKELRSFNNNKNTRFYPAVMSIQTYSGGMYSEHMSNAAYSITGLPYSWHNYSVSTLNDSGKTYYRITLGKFDRVFSKLLESSDKAGFERLAFGDISSSLYCDFAGTGYRRTDAADIMAKALEKAKKQTGSLMLDSANAYAVPYADIIYSSPVCHSGQDILDESVPFYSQVLSGIAECVAAPMNNTNSGDKSELYAAAFGTGICYSWIYEKADILLGTELSGLTGVNYASSYNTVIEKLLRFKELAEKTEGRRMVKHSFIDKDLSVTEYSGGVSVYVNFSKNGVTLNDGTLLEGESFTVKS